MSVVLYSPFHAWITPYIPLFGACIWTVILFTVHQCCNREPTPLEKAIAAIADLEESVETLKDRLAVMKVSQDSTALRTATVLDTLKNTLNDLPTGDNIQEVIDAVIDETREANTKVEEGLRKELKADVAALRVASKTGALRIAEIKDDLRKMKEECNKLKASIETTDGATLKEAVYTSLRAQAERLDSISNWAKNGTMHNPIGGQTSWAIHTQPRW